MPRRIPKDEQHAEETDRLLEALYRDAAGWALDDALPKGWNRVIERNPCAPAKTRVTIRLDAEVATFFRRMGEGHQKRMNDVLRCYMHAVASGQIPGKWDWSANRNPWWKATEFVRPTRDGYERDTRPPGRPKEEPRPERADPTDKGLSPARPAPAVRG